MRSAELAGLLQQAIGWQEEGHQVGVATVAATWGSAPRPAGSRLIAREDGLFEGSVSGGCIEGEAVAAARAAAKSKSSELVHFGVADETAWEVGLSCGGKIDILASPLDAEVAKGIIDAAGERRAVVQIAPCGLGRSELLSMEQAGQDPRCANALERQEPALEAGSDGQVLVEPILPSWRMAIVGATHIAQALVPMASAAGFDAVVIDPRSAWARPERFGSATLVQSWPDEYFADNPPDSATAVIALTHDPKIDDPAIESALAADPLHIAVLGSRRTHARRCERLAEERGLSPEQLERICAPAGLDIGARSHAEIAVSILAEAIAAFRRTARR